MQTSDDGILICDSTTASTGAGTSPQTLFSYSLPKSFLARNGQSLRIKVFGQTAANTHSKTIALTFGATTLLTFTVASAGELVYNIDATLIRKTSTSQVAVAIAEDRTDNNYGPFLTTPAEDTANGNVLISLVCTDGTNSAGDITYNGAVIELLQDNNQG